MQEKIGYNRYINIHRKIKKLFPKPELCMGCSVKPAYDLANISDEYLEDVADWEYLCRSCHMNKEPLRVQKALVYS